VVLIHADAMMWEDPSRLNLAGGPPPSVMSRFHKNCGCWNTRTDTVRAKGTQGMRRENAVWDLKMTPKLDYGSGQSAVGILDTR